MREILFRGKRVDNGEWVYGYLAGFTEGTARIHPHYYLSAEDRNFYCVDPSTVGQCTGLADRNGNWIYDGDVVAPATKDSYVIMQTGRLSIIGNIHDNPEFIKVHPNLDHGGY